MMKGAGTTQEEGGGYDGDMVLNKFYKFFKSELNDSN